MVLPHLEVVHGIIGGLDAQEVRITLREGSVLSVTATAEQVEQATRLREITAMVAMGPQPRLIWIRQEGVDVPVPSAEARDAHALRKWSELLRRLAQ